MFLSGCSPQSTNGTIQIERNTAARDRADRRSAGDDILDQARRYADQPISEVLMVRETAQDLPQEATAGEVCLHVVGALTCFKLRRKDGTEYLACGSQMTRQLTWAVVVA